MIVKKDSFHENNEPSDLMDKKAEPEAKQLMGKKAEPEDDFAAVEDVNAMSEEDEKFIGPKLPKLMSEMGKEAFMEELRAIWRSYEYTKKSIDAASWLPCQHKQLCFAKKYSPCCPEQIT